MYINTTHLLSLPLPIHATCIHHHYSHPTAPSACLPLILSLPSLPLATTPINWGSTLENGHLNRNIAHNAGCRITLKKSPDYAFPERFRVVDYINGFLAVMDDCCEGGVGRGGWIPVGEDEQVVGWLWNPPLPLALGMEGMGGGNGTGRVGGGGEGGMDLVEE